ncbi:MAG TPA: hypothetical protein VMB24_00795 [Dehalococcoidales bacterium]|nr:hypothetical protein [Dehalococcoidales bacterium]
MRNKKKIIVFSGILVLALLFTTGTFAFGYDGQAIGELNGATIAEGAWATYQPSENQPDWNQVLPNGNLGSEIIVPNAEGDETNIDERYPKSGDHWNKVDEYPGPDDAATYVSTYTSSYLQTDLYNLSDPQPQITTEVKKIKSITVYFRASYTGHGDSASAEAIIKTNGTVYTGGIVPITSNNFTTFSFTWAGNPFTGKIWTWDEMNDLQAGIGIKSGAKKNYIACTQVYVSVNYEKKIIQNEVPEGDLFEITPGHSYTGDLQVNIYITNTAALMKAYNYLNIELYVKNSIQATKIPAFQILTLTNGSASFNIEGDSALQYKVQVNGGAYRLTSDTPADWSPGWSVTPELYCEVTQR